MLVRIEGADADALGIEDLGCEEHGGDGHGAGERGSGNQGEHPRETKGNESADLHVPEVDEVLDRLWTVFDPEIPANMVDLGLIYGCEAYPEPSGGHRVAVAMSMTAPGCGMRDILRTEATERILQIPGVTDVEVELVFEPPWDLGRMSEAARLRLGMW